MPYAEALNTGKAQSRIIKEYLASDQIDYQKIIDKFTEERA